MKSLPSLIPSYRSLPTFNKCNHHSKDKTKTPNTRLLTGCFYPHLRSTNSFSKLPCCFKRASGVLNFNQSQLWTHRSLTLLRFAQEIAFVNLESASRIHHRHLIRKNSTYEALSKESVPVLVSLLSFLVTVPII